MIKEEETWEKQHKIFETMQEDRKNHILQCKNKFYENVAEIQKKIALNLLQNIICFVKQINQ